MIPHTVGLMINFRKNGEPLKNDQPPPPPVHIWNIYIYFYLYGQEIWIIYYICYSGYMIKYILFHHLMKTDFRTKCWETYKTAIFINKNVTNCCLVGFAVVYQLYLHILYFIDLKRYSLFLSVDVFTHGVHVFPAMLHLHLGISIARGCMYLPVACNVNNKRIQNCWMSTKKTICRL